MDKLKIFTQKVLPLVYDQSLSYYETLSKVVAKINEIIKYVVDNIASISATAQNAVNTANNAEDIALSLESRVEQNEHDIDDIELQLGADEGDIDNLKGRMTTAEDDIDALEIAVAGKQNTLTFDNVPTNGSTNPVTSDGIYDALQLKQDNLTFDNVPTADSNNPVKSKGILDTIIEYFYRTFPVKTATGSLVSFDDGADDIPVVDAVANVEPQQNLNGYDNPWAGGANDNKWDEVWEAGGISNAGVLFTSDTAIRSKNFNPMSAETNYCLVKPENMQFKINYYDSNYDSLSYYAFRSNANEVVTTPANTAYFKISLGSDLYPETTYNNNVAVNYPSSQTTYSPYKNICPISGWTGANIIRVGNNIVSDLSPTNGSYLTNDGSISYSANTKMYADYIPIIAGSKYIISYANNNPNVRLRVHEYDASQGWLRQAVSEVFQSESVIFEYTTSADASFIRFSLAVTATNVSVAIGNKFTKDWSAVANTVYSGTVDFTTGVLTVNKAQYTFTGNENISVSTQGGNNRFNFYSSPVTFATSPNVSSEKCSMYTVNSSPVGGNLYDQVIYATGTSIIWRDDRYANATEMKTALASEILQIVAPLATPITVQLTPIEIRTLYKDNNIWSDTGNVTISYRADLSTIIAKIESEV